MAGGSLLRGDTIHPIDPSAMVPNTSGFTIGDDALDAEDTFVAVDAVGVERRRRSSRTDDAPRSILKKNWNRIVEIFY